MDNVLLLTVLLLKYQMYKPVFHQPLYQQCSSQTPLGHRLQETDLCWKQWEDMFSHRLHLRQSPASSEWLPSLLKNKRNFCMRATKITPWALSLSQITALADPDSPKPNLDRKPWGRKIVDWCGGWGLGVGMLKHPGRWRNMPLDSRPPCLP